MEFLEHDFEQRVQMQARGNSDPEPTGNPLTDLSLTMAERFFYLNYFTKEQETRAVDYITEFFPTYLDWAGITEPGAFLYRMICIFGFPI
jgi:hypothetical protein